MAALPEDFLKKVIEEAAALKGVTDAAKNVKTNDPVIAACVRVAYTQVCKGCRQPFHYGLRTQVFDEYFGPLLLRSTPIDRQKAITVTVEGEEVTSEDWSISKNRLILYGQTKTDTGIVLYKDVEFTSYCGIALIEEIPSLFTAVQLQAIGNLHRKDSLGMKESVGERNTAKTPADSGELLESVKQLIEELIYNGHGYSLDGE